MSHRLERDPDELREEDVVTLAANHPFLTIENSHAILRYTNEWDDHEEVDLGEVSGVLKADFPDETTIGVLCELAYVTGGRIMSEDGMLDLKANLPRVTVEPRNGLGLEEWRAHVAAERDLTPTEHGDGVVYAREVLGDREEIEFEYRGGRVLAVYPDPQTLVRLARMARTLNAQLVDEMRGPLDLDTLIGAVGAPGRKYSPRETYAVGEEITHPQFGAGVVMRARSRQVDVEFDGETRRLAHGL
ncbi:MAG: hypothetical protein JKY65_03155 [Planctomycetes bacterium]|nr:hypothetical protein [Planctomycetota bacterium]